MRMAEFRYDIAISYASEDEKYVSRVYTILKSEGLSVFYAPECAAEYTAQDMIGRFYKLYRYESLFVVAFVSANYIRKDITMHEAKTALLKYHDENRYCLIPVYMDDSKLPGINADINYINADRYKEVEVAEIIRNLVLDNKKSVSPKSGKTAENADDETPISGGKNLMNVTIGQNKGKVINITDFHGTIKM
jgi:hypothetical protein